PQRRGPAPPHRALDAARGQKRGGAGGAAGRHLHPDRAGAGAGVLAHLLVAARLPPPAQPRAQAAGAPERDSLHQQPPRALPPASAGGRPPLMGALGIVALVGIAWAVSSDRRAALQPRLLGWGLGLQLAMALFALRTPVGV